MGSVAGRVAVILAGVALVGAGALSWPAGSHAAPRLGVNEHSILFGGSNAVDPELAARRARAMGAGMVRVTVSWKIVEPQRGSWRWNRLDEAAATLQRFGLQPLFIVEESPRWAVGRDCRGRTCPPDPAKLAAWRRFTFRLAHRYPRAAAIEIWHGVNFAGHWNTASGPDPERYAELFEVAARSIHRAGTGIPVLIGGMAAIGDETRGSLYAGPYLRRFYAALGSGVLQPGDGIASRALIGRRDVADLSGRVGRHLAVLRGILSRHDPGRKIWLTETGATTGGPSGLPARQQARGLQTVLDRLRRSRDIAAISVHRLFEGEQLSATERGFGIIGGGPAFTPKWAYCRLVARAAGPVGSVGCGRRAGPTFHIVKLRKNRRRGTARPLVQVPGPGRLLLRGSKRVAGDRARSSRPRRVELRVRPRGPAKRKLRRKGRATVRVVFEFAPVYGDPAKIVKRVKLRARRR